MKIKGGSPLSSGAESLEPLDPRELRKTIGGDGFNAALSQLEGQSGAGGAGQTGEAASEMRAALAEIANASNLSSSEGAASAVRESARYIIRARLGEKYRDTEQGQRVVKDLGAYVASDPLLKSKLLSILKQIQTG
ncbi:MAG TPA: hypothetical protein VF656_01370 [Pyrinomonadaceae bacterium]|jgi:hypothetical protein